jgi:hypothetical protein
MGGYKSVQQRGCMHRDSDTRSVNYGRDLGSSKCRAVNKKRVEQSAHMSVSYCCRNYCRTSSSNL